MKADLLIVGGGINGLCLAVAACKKGRHPLIIDEARLPNPNAPSAISPQIIRTHYADFPRYCQQIDAAIHAWQILFHDLGDNYYQEYGIAAIRQNPNDWADRARDVFRDEHIAHRVVDARDVKRWFSGFQFDSNVEAVITSNGGILHAERLMTDLLRYCKDERIAIEDNCKVEQIDVSEKTVITSKGRFDADTIFITSGHEQFGLVDQTRIEPMIGVYADLTVPYLYQKRWLYAPIWVDLGCNANLWGIPRLDDDILRIGAGILSYPTRHYENYSDGDLEGLLSALYSPVLRDFKDYRFQKIYRQPFLSTGDGRMRLYRHSDDVMSYVGDAGQGFKFAALHANLICDTIETGRIGFAARAIGGLE